MVTALLGQVKVEATETKAPNVAALVEASAPEFQRKDTSQLEARNILAWGVIN